MLRTYEAIIKVSVDKETGVYKFVAEASVEIDGERPIIAARGQSIDEAVKNLNKVILQMDA